MTQPNPRRIAANRLNALRSTGPRTEAGKSRSSLNALRTGIDSAARLLPGESAQAYNEVAAGWRRQYPNATPEQSMYLDALALNTWYLRRLTRLERHLLEDEDQFIELLTLPLGSPARSRQLREAARRNDQFRRLRARRERVTRAFASAQEHLGPPSRIHQLAA